MWQLMIAVVSFFIMGTTIIVKQSDRITTLQNQVMFLNDAKIESATQFHDLKQEMKEMNTTMTQVLVTLQNKQDRK